MVNENVEEDLSLVLLVALQVKIKLLMPLDFLPEGQILISSDLQNNIFSIIYNTELLYSYLY